MYIFLYIHCWSNNAQQLESRRRDEQAMYLIVHNEYSNNNKMSYSKLDSLKHINFLLVKIKKGSAPGPGISLASLSVEQEIVLARYCWAVK